MLELDEFKDAKSVASKLVDEFEALPREYTLTIRLPKSLNGIARQDSHLVELSPSLRLVRAGTEFKQRFPLEATTEDLRADLIGGSLLAALMSRDVAEWEENALHLQIEAAGFIGVYGGSNPHQDAIRSLRSFFGLAIALRLLVTKREYRPAKPNTALVVHQRHSGATWEVFAKLQLQNNLTDALDMLRLGTVDGWIDLPERQNVWSEHVFDQIRKVFRAGAKAETILLASQWFFDASCGSDELLAFVQSMIVLEIILGDKATSDQMGLNELLRNRCAYLIGKSQEERAEVHRTFKDIYDVRSQIVHRGKHRLTSNERELFGQLRWMCRRVIQREIELLVANKNADVPTSNT